ncbi:galactose-3-O-sulfotransferase 2-like [Branchiostoma floridae x Branchiostoma belcheri]
MFVKVHKAGSTTTACILQRFGYENNLTFVLPMKGHSNIGWPKLIKRKDFIPSVDDTFNALVDHVIYNKELLQSILPTDTVYIATLRHPFSHLTSVFNWYHLSKRFHGLDQEHPIKTFLETPTKFEIPFNSKHPRRPFSYTKNFMAFDLGFSLGLSGSQSAIDDFVSRLSKDINLVIILEYYNESLVLLRRMMCWTLKDILYDLKPKNFRTYNKSIENVKRLIGKHRQWSNVDYQLYDYFNATLWHRIKQEGDDFRKEVRHFEKVLQSTAAYCARALVHFKVKHTDSDTVGELTIRRSAWNDEFKIDQHFCLKLKMHRWDWDTVLQKKHKLTLNVSDTIMQSIKRPGVKVLNKHLLRKIFNIM